MEKSRKPELKTRIYDSKIKWQDPGLIDLIRTRRMACGSFVCDTTGSGDALCIPSGSGAFDECTEGHGIS